MGSIRPTRECISVMVMSQKRGGFRRPDKKKTPPENKSVAKLGRRSYYIHTHVREMWLGGAFISGKNLRVPRAHRPRACVRENFRVEKNSDARWPEEEWLLWTEEKQRRSMDVKKCEERMICELFKNVREFQFSSYHIIMSSYCWKFCDICKFT